LLKEVTRKGLVTLIEEWEFVVTLLANAKFPILRWEGVTPSQL